MPCRSGRASHGARLQRPPVRPLSLPRSSRRCRYGAVAPKPQEPSNKRVNLIRSRSGRGPRAGALAGYPRCVRRSRGVKRLITGLAVLVLGAVLAACGGAASSSGPAVTVAWAPGSGPVYGVQTATLKPSGSPSGVIALKVVRDGQVSTLARYRFSSLQSSGTAQIAVARRAIDASWDLPGGWCGQDGARAQCSRWAHERSTTPRAAASWGQARTASRPSGHRPATSGPCRAPAACPWAASTRS